MTNPCDRLLDIMDRLCPAKWSDVSACDCSARAKTFFIPRCESIEYVRAAKPLFVSSVAKGATNAGVRDDLRRNGCNVSPEDIENVDTAFDWWHGIYYSSVQLLQWVSDRDVLRTFPNARFIALLDDPCCARCNALNDVIVRHASPALKTFYPPWHLNCSLAWEVSGREVPATPSRLIAKHFPADEQRLFNPFDFLVSWSLLDAK